MGYFTGVGSRSAPPDVMRIMYDYARLTKRRGRTGGAAGIDTAVEQGNHDPVVYLPWAPTGKRNTGIWQYTKQQNDFADSILDEVFPYTLRKQTTRALFRRNVWQVIGLCDRVKDAQPSDVVVCYTADGCTCEGDYNIETTGGTGIAILVADMFHVPVMNIGRFDHRQAIQDWIYFKQNS
jgi:hypothetical protein